ncbi:MAG: hypothetical protein B6I28_00730 [Fusobacteriia bacterium 4572_132]|nr:MAG: hypothetical protein B6I28_00730 [Fusobacteriia bacterium 4572_132]
MRIKTLLKYLFIGIITLSIMERIMDFLEKDYFKITDVMIKGEYSLIQDDIISKLLKLKGKNIWEIDEKKISQYIKNDVRIKRVEIKKTIPDEIEIEIEERKPFVYILWKNKLYLADEEGKIFAYRLEKIEKNLIVLRINKENEIDKIYSVLEKLTNEIKKDISSIYIKDNIIEIQLIDGMIFKTDDKVNMEKYKKGYQLYLGLKQEREINCIDLRFKNYILK